MPFGNETDYERMMGSWPGYEPTGTMYPPSAGPGPVAPTGGTTGNVMSPEMRSQLYSGLTAGPAPAVPAIPTPAVPGTPTSPQSWGERFMSGFQKVSPIMAKAGGLLMGGKDYPAGQVGLLLGQGLESMQLNAALRKMVGEYLSGRGGGLGPTGSPERAGIDDLTAMGLTPEGVKGVYGAGMTAIEKQRKEPFEILGMAADVHNKVALGDYHREQIPMLRAQTESLIATIQNMPYKNFLELNKAYLEVQKLTKDLYKLEEDMRKSEAERKEIGARTEKLQQETRQGAYWNSALGKQTAAEIDAYKTRLGRNVLEIDRGNEVIVFDPVTNRELKSWSKVATPGTGAGVSGTTLANAKWLAASDFLEVARKNMMAKYPADVQKAAKEFEALRFSLKPSMTGEIDTTQLRNALTPDQQALFDQSLDIYSRGINPNAPTDITGAGARVRGMLGTPSPQPGAGTLPPAAGAGAPPLAINPNARIPEKGKPILDINVILPWLNTNITGNIKESEVKQKVYDQFGKPVGLPKSTTDLWVDKNLMGKK